MKKFLSKRNSILMCLLAMETFISFLIVESFIDKIMKKEELKEMFKVAPIALSGLALFYVLMWFAYIIQ